MSLEMFENTLTSLVYEGGRLLISLCVPLLIVPACGVLVAFLLGLFSVREAGMQYAARSFALIALLGAMGSAITVSLIDLMQAALAR